MSQVPVKDGRTVHREPGTARCLWTQTTRFSSAVKPVIFSQVRGSDQAACARLFIFGHQSERDCLCQGTEVDEQRCGERTGIKSIHERNTQIQTKQRE